VRGGDSGHVYFGGYEFDGATVTIEAHVSRYRTQRPSVWGPDAEKFSLTVRASVSADWAVLRGTAERSDTGYPWVARLTKRAALPR
jgi:hypothetical protein